MKNMMTQHWQKAPNFVHGIRVLVTIGCKISETMKGKLSWGARILQLGGVKRVFKQTSARREAVEDFPMLFIDSWPYRWPPLQGLHFPVRTQSNSILQIVNWLNSITRPQSH
ncbi:GEM-like protein 4 isoform X2 [Vitis riparia]|nr:GEM-like protein 4 isoform X2 [Vitis riparia]